MFIGCARPTAAVFNHAVSVQWWGPSSNPFDRSCTTLANSTPYFSLTATWACNALPLSWIGIKTQASSSSVLFPPHSKSGTSCSWAQVSKLVLLKYLNMELSTYYTASKVALYWLKWKVYYEILTRSFPLNTQCLENGQKKWNMLAHLWLF